MYFQYTALSPDNKKLSGTIEAKDEKDARERLNELGLSITMIKVLPVEVPLGRAAGIRFTFEATDRKMKKVVGTIDAPSFDEAFAKLTTDYFLNVQILFPEQVKENEKKFYLDQLETLEFALAQKKEKGEGRVTSTAAAKERQKLLVKVNQTVQTVQAFLNEYGQDMKPEERESIRAYINQLFRIKDSTNLKHIQQTCENMLSYLEKREIFLKETRRLREQATIKVESHELLEEFQKTGFRKEIDIMGLIQKLGKIPFFKNILQQWLFDDENAMELRKKIKALGHRIWEFRKISFKSKDKNYKREIQETIRQLQEERKRYEFELHGLKEKHRLERREAQKTLRRKDFGTGSLFIGWILSFYLVFYFLTFPFAFKNLGIPSIPKTFGFYSIPFLKGILVLLFLFHITLVLRDEIPSKKNYFGFLLYPAFALLYLFFLFNFVV